MLGCGAGRQAAMGQRGLFPPKHPVILWGSAPIWTKCFFSDEKPQTNAEGKRRAAGGCGGSAEKRHSQASLTWGDMMAGRRRAGQPPQKPAGVLASAQGHTPRGWLCKLEGFTQTTVGNQSPAFVCEKVFPPALAGQRRPTTWTCKTSNVCYFCSISFTSLSFALL